MASPARVDFCHVPHRPTRRQLEAFAEEGIQKTLAVGNSAPRDLIKAARRYEGTPHCMGGTSKKCMDCSGLLLAAFRDLGVQVPHSSQAIARYGRFVPRREDLKRGDLVFFARTYRTSKVITHAGIYLGQGKFLHTSSSKGVMVSDVNDPYYWGDKWVFGTRVW